MKIGRFPYYGDAELERKGDMTNGIMNEPTKTIWRSKTFWTGVAGIIAAAGGFYAGEMSAGQAVQTGITCLIGIFLRSGMINQ